MSRKLEFLSPEYYQLEKEAENIHQNRDNLNSSDLQKKTDKFVENLHETYGYDDEYVERFIKRATHQ